MGLGDFFPNVRKGEGRQPVHPGRSRAAFLVDREGGGVAAPPAGTKESRQSLSGVDLGRIEPVGVLKMKKGGAGFAALGDVGFDNGSQGGGQTIGAQNRV